jgi:pilus assembly protein Flp/PilA
MRLPMTWLERVRTDVLRFVEDESGATAIEYGLIAAMIAVAIASAVKGVGSSIKTTLGSVTTSLK